MSRDLILLCIALSGYVLGTLHYLLNLVHPNRRVAAVGTACTLAGFILHTLALVFRFIEVGRPPFASPYETLSFFAWAIVLAYLVFEFRYQNRMIGAFVLPVAVLAGSGAAALPRRIGELVPKLQGVGLWSHVALAVSGNAIFVLTFCAGLLYLFQERQLKSRRPGPWYFRLPSLELLDQMAIRSVLIGFPLLTLALLSGAAWAEHARGSYYSMRAREVWSVFSWLIFAGLLYARMSAGWRGRKAALLAILGFCFVLFSFLGARLLGASI